MQLTAYYLLWMTSIFFITSCTNSLFYYPDKEVPPIPALFQATCEPVTFKSQDGLQLKGWFVPSLSKEPYGTVIHFHGNAQNRGGHFPSVAWLPKRGFNVFVFDYRGYGDSEGHATHQGIYQDAKAALAYISNRMGPEHSLFVLAQSLGGAYAIAALANHPIPAVKALVVDSTFYSFERIGKEKIGTPIIRNLVAWFYIDNDYSAADHVATLTIPIVFIHGTDDLIIPHQHSQDLFALANFPKDLWIIDGGRHIQALTHFGTTYQDKLVTFLTKYKE